MLRLRHLAWPAVLTAAAVMAAGAPAYAHHRGGSEPTLPYAQPATPPKRGCTTVANPTAPTGSTPAVEVIYAWHDGDGNHYEESVEQIARIVDRIDWLIDESTNYDQHLKLSCRYADNGTYADYAHALVVPEKIEAGANPYTASSTVRSDLIGTGYDDSNRYYLVFTDFESDSDAYQCPTTGGNPVTGHCSAVVELWDSGVAGHEFSHVLGAGHAWSGESGGAYYADIMYGWWDYWMADQDFNTYYDPSETTASFYIDPYPSTTTANIARHPALTTPTCCDTGFSNDLLTAQERTAEATAPGTAPTGFTFTGSGSSMAVTPACGVTGVSCTYYDGRRSIQVSVGGAAQAYLAVSRRPAVTVGLTYKFFARLRSDSAKNARLELGWYNSGGTLLSTSTSTDIALTTGWEERAFQATAPTGAATVRLRVTTPTGQGTFTYQVDSLLLNTCNPTCRPGV
ncbi:hypothetical protein F4553_001274 [Allocatelliglobosispora scoriae]|uniref:CBM-cenC domain-containing protein n=1 Tax=Allocatelliglobosispora scoriae TaxID=643052 RepID=A0A841BJS8_9ACTN|nr:carbohydrate binding domain-containing protein [Allocatelliglobosispora scoriae]MBB5867895.1 hypothetical protein [Allocatelliglobosispora scoriae]